MFNSYKIILLNGLIKDERFSKYSSCNDFKTATISVFLYIYIYIYILFNLFEIVNNILIIMVSKYF